MPSLKTLKTRIHTIKSSQKITKAMKLIAASKLKKSRDQLESIKPFAQGLKASLTRALSARPELKERSKLLHNGGNGINLIIAVTSNKGLCGGFNSSVIKAAKAQINKFESEGKAYKIFCIGKKGADVLSFSHKDKIIEIVDYINSGVDYISSSILLDQIIKMYLDNQFGTAWIIYNKFRSAISQVVSTEKILPFDEQIKDIDPDKWGNYECEPHSAEMIDELTIRDMEAFFYMLLSDSLASENGARMSAMDSAIRNADKMLKTLRIEYNRTRQAHITKELIEIISGAEAA